MSVYMKANIPDELKENPIANFGPREKLAMGQSTYDTFKEKAPELLSMCDVQIIEGMEDGVVYRLKDQERALSFEYGPSKPLPTVRTFDSSTKKRKATKKKYRPKKR